MKLYVEAFGERDNIILGNLDGQGVIRAIRYRRTNHYKALVSGEGRPKWSKIKIWKIVDENDSVKETIYNRFFVPAEN